MRVLVLILVAVGTPITRRPPRRSVQAVLPHTALTLDRWRQKILAAHRAIRGTRELPHCVGNVSDRTMFLLGPRPSLPNLRGRQVLVVRLVHRYHGAVQLLLNVHVRRSVYHLRGPVLIFRPRRPGDLPVLVHVVSQRAQVLRLRRTGWPLASIATNRIAFPVTSEGRRPDPPTFRSSIARPTDTSIYASSHTSRCRPQDLRPGWIRCSPFL